MRFLRGVLALGLVAVVGCGDDHQQQPPGAGPDLSMMPTTPDALRVTSFALKYGQSGTPFTYRVLLSKPGQAVWSLKQAPTSAAIDAAGGVLNWTPNDTQGGANDFVVHAELNGEVAEQSFRVQVAVIKVEATQAIDPANPNGGTVAVDSPLSPVHGSAIALQPGALPPGPPVSLTISSVSNLPAPPLAQVAGLGPSDLLPIEFGPSGTAFAKPVSLYLPAPATVLAKGNPTVQTFDYATNRWSSVPVLSVDSAGGVVVAQAPHFTPFVLTPGVALYNLALGLGGAQCASSLVVKAPLALSFAQLPASTVNGYAGAGSSVADVLAGLMPGQALQLYTALHAQTADATASQDGWMLASAALQMDGTFQVAISSDAHAPVGVNIPAQVAAADVPSWLDGSRVDAVFGGLGAGISSGASVSAELSLYLVAGPDAQKPPAQVVNAVGKDTTPPQPLTSLTGQDSDCDGAPDAFDATPTGPPPPSLQGSPAMAGVTVGNAVTFTVVATGATLTWSASDPSVTLTPSADGLSAVATPTLAGQFHVDVVGTAGSGSARFSFALAANPPGMVMPPPPVVVLSSSSNSVHAGGSLTVSAYGKSPLPLTFRWSAPMGVLSATTGDTVVFSAANPGDYVITCIGNDGTQDSSPASIQLSVLPAGTNQAPPAPMVTPMSALLQHGSGQGVMAVLTAQAIDPDGDPVTYDFQADAQNPAGFMLVKNGASATFFSGTDGTYVFYVTATDSHGATSPWTAVKLQVVPTLPSQPVDADNDGYPAGIDCNDNDPTIHPGQKQSCDGVDRACNGKPLTAATCDADGDRVTQANGDCDDHDPTRFPGAVEICDGIDNDCDGVKDNGFAIMQSCTVGVGACAATGSTVCNTAHDGVTCNATPGTPTPETCNNIDDDCNGVVDDVSATATGTVSQCGGCNFACNAPANETPACVGGGCTYTCQAGFVDADHNPANGCECQLTNNGVETCDGVDNDCNGIIDDNLTQVFYDGPSGTQGVGVCSGGVKNCVGGVMVIIQPERVPGVEICNGIDDNCDGHVDETIAFGMDANNCGKCGNVCQSGMCQAGICVSPLADMAVGPADGGTSGCPGGFVMCASGCSPLVNDNNNCGACGMVCGAGTFCTMSACMPTGGGADMGMGSVDGGAGCPMGFAMCASGCSRLVNDNNNCGACGKVCGAGTSCTMSMCMPMGGGSDMGMGSADGGTGCPGGFLMCPTGCANVMSDPNNCGGCGKPCTAGNFCNMGMCVPMGGGSDLAAPLDLSMPFDGGGISCPAGFTACGTDCEYLQLDPGNCGTCGNICAAGTTCNNGVCVAMGAGTYGAACQDNTQCSEGLACFSKMMFGFPQGFCAPVCDSKRACGANEICNPYLPGTSGDCLPSCKTDPDCQAYPGLLCLAGMCQPDCRMQPNYCHNGQTCGANGQCGQSQPVDMAASGPCLAPNAICPAPGGGTVCTGLAFDNNNCGACGRVCSGGQSCQNGTCASPPTDGSATMPTDMGTGGSGPCGAPRLMCGSTCVDPTFDNNNCGGCGNICSAGFVCQNSLCVTLPPPPDLSGGPSDAGGPVADLGPAGGGCPAGFGACGGGCVNLQTDSANCGNCFMQCSSGTVCQGGTCVAGGSCTPMTQQSCYTGPPGTAGVGACHAGQQMCDPSGHLQPQCNGEQVPSPTEICGDGVDNNCNGVVDEGCPLGLAQKPFTIVSGDTFQLVASGGTAPYTWTTVSSGSTGGVNASGLYSAGNMAGNDVVQVADANGAKVQINITVVGSLQVTLSPPSGTTNHSFPIQVLMPVHSTVTSASLNGQSIQVQATPDGTVMVNPPFMNDGTYTLTVQASGFASSTASANGTYVYDRTPPATPTVTGPAPNASLPGPTVDVTGTSEPNAVVQITESPNGGQILGQAIVDAMGGFTITTQPLATGQHDLFVIAVDGAGNTSQAASVAITITSGVAAPLQPSPQGANVTAGGSVAFLASGGTPPYTWSLVSSASGGNITAAGAYTAGMNSGTDYVLVTDSATPATQVEVGINVSAPLTVTITNLQNGAQVPSGTPLNVIGQTSPGAQLNVLVDGMGYGGAGADQMGNFNIPLPGNFAIGPHTLEVDAQMGPSSGKAVLTFNVFAAMVTLTSPGPGQQVSPPVTLMGTVQPNVTVAVFLDGMPLGAPMMMGGNWSIQVQQTLPSGPHNWYATGTDMTMATYTTPTQSFNVGAAAITITGSQINTYVSPTGAQTPVPVDLSTANIAAVINDGSGHFTSYPGSGAPNGNFSIPNVPLNPGQPYYLRVNQLYGFGTKTTNIDLGTTKLGRSDAIPASAGSITSLDVTGMAPFDNGVNGGFLVLAPELGQVNSISPDASSIAVGATSATGLLLDWSPTPAVTPFLVDGSRGDTVSIAQYVGTMNANNLSYSQLVGYGVLPSFTQPAGMTTNQAVMLNAVPATSTFNVNWQRSAFDSVMQNCAPNATFLESAWVLGSGPAPLSSEQLTNLTSMEDDLKTDLVSSFPYGDPYPATWGETVQFQHGYSMQVQATGATTPTQVNLVMVDNETVSSINGMPLAPRTGPATNIQINGQNANMSPMVPANGAISLSWTPPAGTVTFYRVQVFQVVNNGGQTATQQRANIVVAPNAVPMALPQGILMPGSQYFIKISSVFDQGFNINRPLEATHYPSSAAPAATAVFNAM
jgi:hypothetical protein